MCGRTNRSWFASTGSPAGFRSRPAETRSDGGRPGSGRRGERGFTLLETLTALAILALALSSLFGTFSNNLRAVRTSEHYSATLALAQALLVKEAARAELRPQAASGRLGGARWSLRISPADALAPPFAKADPWRLYRVAVDVTGPAGRRVHLQTLKLAKRHDPSS